MNYISIQNKKTGRDRIDQLAGSSHLDPSRGTALLQHLSVTPSGFPYNPTLNSGLGQSGPSIFLASVIG